MSVPARCTRSSRSTSTSPIRRRRSSIGLPAELLRQRPDVRRAERELAAQTAQIGVATAELYPRFALTGTFTLAATDAGEMWDQSARDNTAMAPG